MNPEYDHEAQMALWRAKDAKEDAANPALAERNYTEELRQYDLNPRTAQNKLFSDSERDDVDLRGAFHDENNFADVTRAVDNILRSQSEYQVDPLDMDEYGEKSDYEYWAEEGKKDAALLHTRGEWLSNEDLDQKVDLHQTDPFDPPEMPPEPPANAIAAEGERVQPTPPASETGPSERPSVIFDGFDGYRHEYYRDGRRVKTPIGKPAPKPAVIPGFVTGRQAQPRK